MTRMSFSAMLALAVLAGTVFAAEAHFTAKPTAKTVGDKVQVSFALSQPTDVTVAIVDGSGIVVRHLAAGMLGKNPPPPLQPNTLHQTLIWNGKDDDGKPAVGGPFKVRVRLGLKTKFKRVIGWSGQNIDGPRGMVCGPDGTLYVIFGSGLYAHRQASLITAYDRQGKYLHQVFPGPANLPLEKRKGWPRIKLEDGEEMPVVFHLLSRAIYPGAVFAGRNFPAATDDGRLVMLSGADRGTTIADADMREGRRLLILGCDGSVPRNFLGPVVAEEQMGGFGHVALSPDDKYAYVAGLFEGGKQGRGLCNVVWRVRLDGSGPAKVFIGKLYTAGNGKSGLNDPQGLATDGQGNLYVADYGNNRIAVFNSSGKFVAEIPVDYPDQVRVSRRTGAIYVMCLEERTKGINDQHYYASGHNWRAHRIVKFASLAEPAEKAVFLNPHTARYGGGALLALDGSSDPPILWLAGTAYGRSDVLKVVDRGNTLESPGDPIHGLVEKNTALPFIGDVAILPDKVISRLPTFGWNSNASLVFNANSGLPEGTFVLKDEKGKPENYWSLVYGEVIAGKDGNVYVHADTTLRRYDASGKALPFQTTGSHVLENLPFDRHTRNSTLFVTRKGDIYIVVRKQGKGQARAEDVVCVRLIGPDGRVKHDCLIPIQAARLGGLAVDLMGNIYLGAQVVERDNQDIVNWFAGRLPDDSAHRFPRRNYLQYGAILKFPSTGGEVRIDPDGKYVGRRGYVINTVSTRSLLWLRRGGLVPGKGSHARGLHCNCESTRFDIDDYGRLFVPDVFRFSVRVLDSSGNEITHFGSYGNMDSQGPDSTVPTPDIPLGWPLSANYSNGCVYVADLVNRRVVKVRLEYAAEATCSAAVAANEKKPARKGPLTKLPSRPGPHIAKIKAMGNNSWLDLGQPKPDPKWGDGVGRAWSSKMAYAPDLRGAFLYGQGVHGGTSMRNGKRHYNDDLFFYDINGHEWVCVYPGMELGKYDLTISKEGFEIDRDGHPRPVACMVHAYGGVTYDTDRKAFVHMWGPSGSGYWEAHMPKRVAFISKHREKLNGLGGHLRNGWKLCSELNQASPWIYDTVAGHWRRRKTAAKAPGLHYGNLIYVGFRQQLYLFNGRGVHVYDPHENTWQGLKPKGPAPPRPIDAASCYDPKRRRVYIAMGSYGPYKGQDNRNRLWAYDLAKNTWVDLQAKGKLPPRPQGVHGRSITTMHYDSANDTVLFFAFGKDINGSSDTRGIYGYDPAKNEWTLATGKFPDWRGCNHAFYAPELNAHFIYKAGDSKGGGKMWVYRYKRAEKK